MASKDKHRSLLRDTNQPARIYGHRGARGVLPENTLESFSYLSEIGIDAVEFDIQLTSDAQLILLHDPFVPEACARTSNGDWLEQPGPKVIDTRLSELLSFDIGRFKPGSAYGARYPEQQPLDGARIPTLESFFDWAKGHPDLLINIEVKSYADRDDLGAPPDILVKHLVNLLDRFRLDNPIVVSSFDWRILSCIRNKKPQIKRGYISYYDRETPTMQPNIINGSPWMDGLSLDSTGGSLPRLIAAEGGIAWCPYFTDLTPETLSEAHAEGLAVNVWTVNEAADITYMNDMGVDGIITDYPLRAKKILGLS